MPQQILLQQSYQEDATQSACSMHERELTAHTSFGIGNLKERDQ